MKIEELFIIYQRERLPSQDTIRNYVSLLRVFQRDTGINSILVDHDSIIMWRENILKRASINTWNTYLRQMKALFQLAVERGYLVENPFKKIKTITCYQRQCKLIDDKSFIAINRFLELDINNNWFWKIAIDLLYSTGIRRKQLVSLIWNDINFKEQTIRLSIKGSKTKRENLIPITSENLSNLRVLHEMTIETNLGFSLANQVFNITLFDARYKSDQMTREHVSNFFKLMSTKLGIIISAHKFRHTMATKIANNSHNIRALQDLMGHSNISTTLSYVHPKISDLRKLQALLR